MATRLEYWIMLPNILDHTRPVRQNDRMSNKKQKSGKHKVPRKAVQFPIDWLAIARRLAAENRQPTMWFLVGLVAEAAERRKEVVAEKDLPPFPWKEKDE